MVPVDAAAAAAAEEIEVAGRRGENIDGLLAGGGLEFGIKVVIKEISNFISFNTCNRCCSSRIYTAQKPMTDRLRLRYDRRPQGKASREAVT